MCLLFCRQIPRTLRRGWGQGWFVSSCYMYHIVYLSNLTLFSAMHEMKPCFRDHKTAPLAKLTIDLINTYKHINEVSTFLLFSLCSQLSFLFISPDIFSSDTHPFLVPSPNHISWHSPSPQLFITALHGVYSFLKLELMVLYILIFSFTFIITPSLLKSNYWIQETFLLTWLLNLV